MTRRRSRTRLWDDARADAQRAADDLYEQLRRRHHTIGTGPDRVRVGSISDLARYVGVPRPYMSHIVNGTAIPTPTEADMIAEYLNVTPEVA